MSRPKGSKNKKKKVMDTMGADFELKDTVKRPRGRPKKAVIVDEASFSDTQVVKRGRGRPKKIESISAKTLETMDSSVKNLKEGKVGESIIKKSRGRPRKTAPISTEINQTTETTPIKEEAVIREMEKPGEALEESSLSETSESSENKPKKGKKIRKERAEKSIRAIESSGATLPPETTEFKYFRGNDINHLIMKSADLRVPMESFMYSYLYKDKVIFGYGKLTGEEGRGWFFKYKWFIMDRKFKLLNEFNGKRRAMENRGKYDGENIDCSTFLQMKIEELY